MTYATANGFTDYRDAAHAAPRRPGLPPVHAPESEAPVSAHVVQMMCESRKERAKFLSHKLLGEPGWDILLQLYAAHLDGCRMSITRLTRCTGIAATTVLRWVKLLYQEGLLSRSEDPNDLRRVYVALTPSGEEALNRFFAVSGTRALLF